jgi:DNA sulfur modification protein DndE
MLPNRLKISQSATDILKMLKGRTGLTPNIVCRIALVLSFEDGIKGGLNEVDQSGSEFNASTLFGEFSGMFECMLREVHGHIDAKVVATVIASHIEDGLDRLRKSKNIIELVEYSGFNQARDKSHINH